MKETKNLEVGTEKKHVAKKTFLISVEKKNQLSNMTPQGHRK